MASKPETIDVLLTLSPAKYHELGEDIDALRRQLGDASASNTEIILKAVRQARRE